MTQEEYECEKEAFICEREGMILSNKRMEAIGQSVAYTSENFFELAEKFRALGWEREETIKKGKI